MSDGPMRQSIVIDKDGNPWGPFDDAIKAASWAKRKWPDQEQDDVNPLDSMVGWDIWALRAPD